jgi:prepilin-type N-terminal cleavage/methylation domain-containing protein
MKNFKKGFTLIELLVVIAIVGLLSSVVLASLQNARLKAADAKIKESLATIRSEAALWEDDNDGSYTGLFDSGTKANAMYQSALAASGTTDGDARICDPENSLIKWYVIVRLRADNTKMWYVDDSGKSEQRDWNNIVLCTS